MLKRILLGLACVLVANLLHADPLFRDLKGNNIDLSQLQNKWVVINYWASWCGACVEEIPELNNLYHHNKNIVLYGVNYDHLAVDELAQASQETGIKFPLLVDDPGQVWALETPEVLPMTFIINPQGKVVKRFVGPTTEQAIADTLQTLQHTA